METVIRRGPWTYVERMLVLHRWAPLMDMDLFNYIPFWIQIRGTPFQFMNREVILNIARAMNQQYSQIEYNEENSGRLEFIRFRLNWNINHPLKFQRNFQFSPGENTLLRFHYERLRGLCESCGLITHDTGACVINNGGPPPGDGNDDSGDENDEEEIVPNQGIIIDEIVEEEEAADPEPELTRFKRHIRAMWLLGRQKMMMKNFGMNMECKPCSLAIWIEISYILNS